MRQSSTTCCQVLCEPVKPAIEQPARGDITGGGDDGDGGGGSDGRKASQSTPVKHEPASPFGRRITAEMTAVVGFPSGSDV